MTGFIKWKYKVRYCMVSDPGFWAIVGFDDETKALFWWGDPKIFDPSCAGILRKEFFEDENVIWAKQYEAILNSFGEEFVNSYDRDYDCGFFWNEKNGKEYHQTLDGYARSRIINKDNHDGMVYNEYTDTWSWF